MGSTTDEGAIVFQKSILFPFQRGPKVRAAVVVEMQLFILLYSKKKRTVDFKTFRGFPIEVTHLDQNDSPLCVEGLLLGRDDDTLQINIRGRIKRINRDRVVNVRLTSPGV